MDDSRDSTPEPKTPGHAGAVGLTQSIRSRLNFTDESKWKRFSARRLELIDSHDLSSKKPSEQEEKIKLIADTLREEYEYGPDRLGDFDRLVRAGIQSVRRNRKRVPKSRAKHNPTVSLDYNVELSGSPVGSESNSLDVTPAKRVRSLTTSPEPHSLDRVSIGSLISSPAPLQNPTSGDRVLLPPMAALSIATDSPPPVPTFAPLTSALERLAATVARAPPPLVPAQENLQWLGECIISTATAYAIEEKLDDLPSKIMFAIRMNLLAPPFMSALAKTVGASSYVSLELILAEHSKSAGFEVTIKQVSTVVSHVLSLDPSVEYSSSASLAKILTSHAAAIANANTNAKADTSASASASKFPHDGADRVRREPLPLVRPVTLRFLAKQFEFTYAAHTSTPPTVEEIIDNAKTAFHIVGDGAIQIRDLNRRRVLESDADVADAFTNCHRIDLELFIPAVPRQDSRHTTPGPTLPPPSGGGDPGTRLPPFSHIAKPRFQELAHR